MRQIIASCQDAVCRVECPDLGSSGTGFFVRPTGIVVTCNHVVAKEMLTGQGLVELAYSQNILIMIGANAFTARFAHPEDDWDPYFHDYALLRLEDQVSDRDYIELGDYDATEAGDAVLVLGYPLGVTELTATRGMVAVKHRSPSERNALFYQDMLRVDGTVNPGNSGGPLLNGQGKAVGIVSLRHGSILPLVARLRENRDLSGRAGDPLYQGIVELFEWSNTFLNPGLAEAVSMRYAAAKLTELGL